MPDTQVLTGPALDAAVGQALDITPRPYQIASRDRGESSALSTQMEGITQAKVRSFCEAHPEYLVVHKWEYPPFSTSLDACREMEDELERRGKQTEYGDALLAVLGMEPKWQVMMAYDIWSIAHATPEQRCRAALEAVKS